MNRKVEVYCTECKESFYVDLEVFKKKPLKLKCPNNRNHRIFNYENPYKGIEEAFKNRGGGYYEE